MDGKLRFTAVMLLCLFLIPGVAAAADQGEPLVVKSGKAGFQPALAREWAQMGQTVRMVLRSGVPASRVAEQLAAGIAPWTVEAADEVTLVFRGPGLELEALLEKLSDLPVKLAGGNELAQLAELEKTLGPAMADLSATGSIRASKQIQLPASNKPLKPGPADVVARVVEVSACEPLPTFTVVVTRPPAEGEHRAAFAKDTHLQVRGFYQIEEKTGRLVPDEPLTKINLASKSIEPGQSIFGKPLLKEAGGVWILETIRAVSPEQPHK